MKKNDTYEKNEKKEKNNDTKKDQGEKIRRRRRVEEGSTLSPGCNQIISESERI